MPKIENTKWKIGKPYDSRRVEITTDNPGGVETLVAVCEPQYAARIAAAPDLLACVQNAAIHNCYCEGPCEEHDGKTCEYHAAITRATTPVGG